MKPLNKITLILMGITLPVATNAAEESIPSYQTMPSMFSVPIGGKTSQSPPLTTAESQKLDKYLAEATKQNIPVGSNALVPTSENIDQESRLEKMQKQLFEDTTSATPIVDNSLKVKEGDEISPFPKFTDQTQQAQVQPVVQPDPMKSRAMEIYKPKVDVTVMPSEPVTIAVAVGRSNKVSFNFKELDIRTSNLTATILQDGGDLYIAPNSPEPIGLLIGEKGVPDTMINLLLLPVEVPPVIAKLRVQLSSKLERERSLFLANQEEKKRKAEEELKQLEKELNQSPTEMDRSETAYIERIASLLKVVALEEIPQGFTLKLPNEIAEEDLYPCDSTKLLMYHKTIMQLESQREVIDIVKVTNDLNKVRSVEDEYCISEGVYAASTFKKSHLAPGESTEMYILRKNNFRKEQLRLNSRKRPSLRD